MSTSSTAANWPVRLIDSRTSPGFAATSKPWTVAVPASAFSSVDRIRTSVVLPAPFEPSSAKMLPALTSKSTPRSTCRSLNDFSMPCTRMAVRGLSVVMSVSFRRFAFVDRLRSRRARSLSIHRRTAVGLGERLGELHRVVADDRAHRRSVDGGALTRVGEVAEHPDEGFAVGDAAVVHEVPLERLRGGAVGLGEGLDAGLVLPVLLLLLERPGEGFDPFCRHDYSPSSCGFSMWWWSFSIRSARKLQVLQNSSRYSPPSAFSV